MFFFVALASVDLRGKERTPNLLYQKYNSNHNRDEDSADAQYVHFRVGATVASKVASSRITRQAACAERAVSSFHTVTFRVPVRLRASEARRWDWALLELLCFVVFPPITLLWTNLVSAEAPCSLRRTLLAFGRLYRHLDEKSALCTFVAGTI